MGNIAMDCDSLRPAITTYTRHFSLLRLVDSQAPIGLDLTIALFKPIHALLNKIAGCIHGHRVCASVPAGVIQRVTDAVEHGPGLHQA